MRLFEKMYARVMRWSQQPQAPYALAGLSFVEAFAFPVMPEIMLAPMALAKPERAFGYANLSLLCSILGSLVGYALGHYLFDALRPLLADLGWLPTIEHWVGLLRSKASSHPWSVFGMLVLAGFVPVPMKFFTWASGIVGLPLLPFVASMAVGRGKRVWLLAWLIRSFGIRAEQMLRRYSEWVGWTLLVLVVVVLGWWWHHH
ncbi:YqaA family protein [Frateuria aurantia]